jgi:hypothetical protein
MPKKARTTGCERSWTILALVVEWWTGWPSWICRWRPTTWRGTDRQRAVRQRSSGGQLEIARAVRIGEIDIDPDDDKLAAQLGSIKWGIDSRGRIKIESKDDMRKRCLPSPDRADAMAIGFAGSANAAPINVESHAGESITGDLVTKAWWHEA